ncbi:hypothetical protein H310_05381 [Aphanomyces invadans]|uniref:Nitric oxide dioxygenase n=1 Tax=Aphanomyces invadans TaxID=157072 RepID=A0A024UBF4_9STRA|nr:hypothetical protein H310_05381 [Aphanomyces invadans]ETW02928.1 hypothetical protein H310_05381 [Aphanomyces invadans]RHY31935.1 hypothetical protein DYB32_003027 [Aphanomyces invadans]|eukprot:XP_008868312.1 hypothetical protein H310_05381 [Aphanomyces invadans]
MGGNLSSKHSKIIFATADGSVGIKPGFAQKYAPYMPLDVKLPVLTPRHVELIKANWAAICIGTSAFDAEKHGSPDKFFHRTFYSLLFNADPSLRAIFRSSLTMQGKSLASIIKVMTGVMSASNIVERMQALATGHLKFGVKREYYVTMGITLVKTLEVISGTSWSRDVKEAYLTAYCLLFYLVLPVVVHYQADPVQDSIPCAITNVDAIAPKSRRLTLEFDFPLRFQPGDGILLGSGNTKVCFPIASFHDRPTSTLDICVDMAASDWLCRQAMCSKLKLFWVASNVNFEIDTPETGLPHDVLLISYGVGAAPFVAMMQGLYSVKDVYRGRVVALQCAPTMEDIAFFHAPQGGRYGDLHAWDQCTIHYAARVTEETFLEMAPNSLDDVEVIVNGPKDFVIAVSNAYAAAGGKTPIKIYGFDNPRQTR